MLGWQHNYSRVIPRSTFAFESGSIPFIISGAPLAKNMLTVDAGLDWTLLPQNLRLRVAYIGQLSQAVNDNGITATLAYNWA